MCEGEYPPVSILYWIRSLLAIAASLLLILVGFVLWPVHDVLLDESYWLNTPVLSSQLGSLFKIQPTFTLLALSFHLQNIYVAICLLSHPPFSSSLLDLSFGPTTMFFAMGPSG